MLKKSSLILCLALSLSALTAQAQYPGTCPPPGAGMPGFGPGCYGPVYTVPVVVVAPAMPCAPCAPRPVMVPVAPICRPPIYPVAPVCAPMPCRPFPPACGPVMGPGPCGPVMGPRPCGPVGPGCANGGFVGVQVGFGF